MSQSGTFNVRVAAGSSTIRADGSLDSLPAGSVVDVSFDYSLDGGTTWAGGRKASGWVDSSGQITAGPLNFTGMTTAGAGSLLGGRPLTSDAAANAAGAYTVDSITETGSSS